MSKREQTMQGNEKVLEQLNTALSSELTAIVQYMTQSEMCSNWGYAKMARILKTRAIEEMKHAETLIERIIFLDGTPRIDVALKPRPGANVPQILEIDLQDELDAVRDYNVGVQVCAGLKDDGSRQLFERLLKDEERHVDLLESELHSLGEVGLANYLAQQLRSD
jgi:bacterioferritin